MSTSNTSTLDIPTALPGVEDESEREKLLRATAETSVGFEDGGEELDDELDEEIEQLPPSRTSKRRAVKAIACLLVFFVLLFLTISWFFDMGIFATDRAQPVNRTAKGDTPAAISEDEKLRMALGMVAAREPSVDSATAPAENETAVSEIPNQPSTELENAVPGGPISIDVPALRETRDQYSTLKSNNDVRVEKSQTQPIADQSNATDGFVSELRNSKEPLSPGRSVFFGKDKTEVTAAPSRTEIRRSQDAPTPSTQTAGIPFGTLVPVRLASAVYSFRNSGGFIRMELTRAIDGKNYSYPAGTVLVGTLRGAESARAFVTVTGLVDPASGQLLKVSGELLGRDGASGITGRKRKLASTWSRLLRGLRETGSSIIGSIGNWRSGGTVILSDSMGRVGTDIWGSSRVDTDSFVQVDAGSMGFVQITDLPSDSSPNATQPPASSASGLADEELADLFSEGSPDKLRAALPRMTPEFRRIAEQVIEANLSR